MLRGFLVFEYAAISEIRITLNSPSLTSPANCPRISQTHLRAIAEDRPSVTLNNLNFSVHVSPRGREKRIMQRRWPTCPGITPRWAGCHPHAYRITISRTTHPRVGGENRINHLERIRPQGSSPHGRRKRRLHQGRSHNLGLIPARAGKTSHGPDHRLASTAHPRAGGENPHQGYVEVYAQGSSPRGRGKPVARGLGALCPRLIPAWAGKTELTR